MVFYKLIEWVKNVIEEKSSIDKGLIHKLIYRTLWVLKVAWELDFFLSGLEFFIQGLIVWNWVQLLNNILIKLYWKLKFLKFLESKNLRFEISNCG